MSIRNILVKAYMRLTSHKSDGDKLTLEERQKDNLPQPPARLAVRINWETFSVDGAKAVWISRENAEKGVMVYLHGGSYIAGPFKQQWEYLADMCRRTGLAALLIDYRPAPQHPFPAGLNDVVIILETLSAAGDLPENWFLLGDSAGAGLATAVVWKLKELNETLPKKMILMSGWFDLTLENPEIQKNYQADPVLSLKRLGESARGYIGRDSAKNPLISPVFGDFQGLPPTLIQVGTAEMVLWENRQIYQKCREAGVSVKYEEYPNTFHCFMMLALLPEAAKARNSQTAFLLS